MFQEFYKDTLISRFIKRLLRATNIPLLHTLHQDSEILEGCLYLYENYVIKCVKSGRFYVNPEEALYPGDTIYPSKFLLPSRYVEAGTDSNGNSIFKPQGNYILGKYQVLKYYDESDTQIHYNFHSRYLYYDSETHQHLGEYLRYLRDRKNLNLMPYYNCFSNKVIHNAYLTATNDRHFEPESNKNYKLLAVPVKYGQTYTIAIDSDTPVQIRTLIYNDDCGVVLTNVAAENAKEYYSDSMIDYEVFPNTCFTKPFLKVIEPAESKALYQQEKNLYLIIQVAKENTSALTVLEGNYISSWNKIISDMSHEKVKQKDFHKNLSLLHFNSRTSFAFSDRLIEYLLLSVINHTETLDGNIKYTQELIENYDKTYSFRYKGIWTEDIKSALYYLENKLLDNNLIRDLDGYLNKDLERLLRKGVIN